MTFRLLLLYFLKWNRRKFEWNASLGILNIQDTLKMYLKLQMQDTLKMYLKLQIQDGALKIYFKLQMQSTFKKYFKLQIQ